MAIPGFKNFILPILTLFSDGNEHTTSECKNTAINYFKLDKEDIKITVPSGKQTLVANRVYWSLTTFMIEYNVGVQNNYIYEIKKIDNDYFEML